MKIPMQKLPIGEALKWLGLTIAVVLIFAMSIYLRRCEVQFWMNT